MKTPADLWSSRKLLSQPWGCQTCGGSLCEEIEISRLVQENGELLETPVLAMMRLCDSCQALLAAGDWNVLATRRIA